MQVAEYMSKEPVSIEPGHSVFEAKGLMHRNGFRHLPVVDGGKVVGVITQTDLLAASLRIAQQLDQPGDYIEQLRRVQIGEHMKTNVISITPECSLQKAALILRDKKIGCLPVIGESEQLVGIITETDLFDALAQAVGFFSSEGEQASKEEGEQYVL